MLRTKRRRRSGQALAEFALVLPVLALLLFGIVQFGITFGGYNALINSVREAARYGSVCVGSASSCGSATATYLGTKISQSGFGYAGLPTGQVQYQAYQEPPDTGLWNVRMQVTGCVNAQLFIPLIGNILNPTSPGVLPMRSVEIFRVEGMPAQNPTSDPDIPNGGTWGTSFTLNGGC